MLQEIQYDSQGQPLYQHAFYIAENVNGDVIVTDSKKRIVIAVNRLGIFRYTYSGRNNELDAFSVAGNVNGDVIVTDYKKRKVIVVDRLGIVEG